MFCLNGGAVSWKSSKQSIVADSTTEAEYIAASDAGSHQRSKHILMRYHLIREIIERGDVKICRVPTDDNVADPLTKPLPPAKHDRHARFIGIRYIDEWA